MARHSWYKFFPERRWADAFLDGSVLFRSLGYFRDYEDAETRQIIGDRYEGTQTAMPESGIIMRARDTGATVKFIDPFAFNAVVETGEIFVFCVSQSFTPQLIHDFRAVGCVEIVNKPAFFQRLMPTLPATAKFISGSVEYYDSASGPEALKALLGASPEKIVRSKLRHFCYQEEYRFAFSETAALDAGSARYCLREFKPVPNLAEHHSKTLQLGCLRDICKLHELSRPAACSKDRAA